LPRCTKILYKRQPSPVIEMGYNNQMIVRSIKKVYANKFYVVLASIAFLVLPVISASVMNWGLLMAVGNPLFIVNLMFALPFTVGWVSFLYLIVTSILFGLNIGLVFYYFRVSGRAHTSGFWASLLALIGLGCASCGSLLFLPLIGTFLVGGSFFLPFVIIQLPLVGIVIMLWSIYTLAKKIDNPYIMSPVRSVAM